MRLTERVASLRGPFFVLKKYNQYSFLAAPLTTTQRPSPYRLPIGMIEGKPSSATLSQLRNIDSKRLIRKIGRLEADLLDAIRKEASRVNLASLSSFALHLQGEPFGHLYHNHTPCIMDCK